MVACKDVGARLSPFLRGALPFTDRLSIHSHLAVCAACSQLVEQGRDVLDVSKSASAAASDPVPDEVPEQLVRAILITCWAAR